VTSTLIRRAGLLLTAAALPLVVAGPAAADVPEGWSDPEEVGLMHLLLVIGVLPLAIALLIALAVYGPALRRGERVAPGHHESPDEWFGGPRQGAGELEPARAADSRTGGASGSW
jgi:hypothetical protein